MKSHDGMKHIHPLGRTLRYLSTEHDTAIDSFSSCTSFPSPQSPSLPCAIHAGLSILKFFVVVLSMIVQPNGNTNLRPMLKPPGTGHSPIPSCPAIVWLGLIKEAIDIGVRNIGRYYYHETVQIEEKTTIARRIYKEG